MNAKTKKAYKRLRYAIIEAQQASELSVSSIRQAHSAACDMMEAAGAEPISPHEVMSRLASTKILDALKMGVDTQSELRELGVDFGIQ